MNGLRSDRLEPEGPFDLGVDFRIGLPSAIDDRIGDRAIDPPSRYPVPKSVGSVGTVPLGLAVRIGGELPNDSLDVVVEPDNPSFVGKRVSVVDRLEESVDLEPILEVPLNNHERQLPEIPPRRPADKEGVESTNLTPRPISVRPCQFSVDFECCTDRVVRTNKDANSRISFGRYPRRGGSLSRAGNAGQDAYLPGGFLHGGGGG